MAGMRFVNKHLLPYIQYDNVIWLIREFSVLITLQEDFSQTQKDSLFTYNFAEISLLTFLSTTSTFVLEALFSGRLLVYQWAPTVHLYWLISSFIPSSTISWSKQ